MLEYFMLRALCTALGNQARAKGYNAFGYQAMLVALWFGGEISGLILGFVLAFALSPHADEPNWLIAVVIGYATAAAGAGLTFLLVKWQPDCRDPGLRAVKEDWDAGEVRQRFGPRAASSSKDVTTERDEAARREDERYATE